MNLAITSKENAQQLGLSVPDKSIHVVDKAGPELLFSTNSMPRAGQFEVAKEAEQAALVRAKQLHDEAARVEAEAAKAAEKASALHALEGDITKKWQMIDGVGLSTIGMATAVASQEVAGVSSGYGAAASFAVVGALLGGALAKEYPRAAAAVSASFFALAGRYALVANGTLPAR